MYANRTIRERPASVATLRLGITRSYTCNIYNEPDNVSKFTTPLNAATPNNCRALARNPAVTGSSEFKSNLRFIACPSDSTAACRSSNSVALTLISQSFFAHAQVQQTSQASKLTVEVNPGLIGIYDLVNNATLTYLTNQVKERRVQKNALTNARYKRNCRVNNLQQLYQCR